MIVSLSIVAIGLWLGGAPLDENTSGSKSDQGACAAEKAGAVASSCADPERIASLLDQVLKGEPLELGLAGEAAKGAESCAVHQLGMILKAEPAAWDAVAEPLVRAFTCQQTCPSIRGRIADLLLMAADERALATAETLLARLPQAFADVQVVAFAERGSKPFTHAVYARLEDGSAKSVYPAAFCLAYGKQVCEVSLAKARAVCERGDLSCEGLAETLVAALALKQAGCTRAVPALQRGLHAAILAALDAGQQDEARTLALRAEFLSWVVLQGHAQYGLSGIQWAMQEHVARSAERLLDADAIFELAERVRPAS